MSGLIKWRGKPEDVSEPRRMIRLVRREAPREIETPARSERSVLPARLAPLPPDQVRGRLSPSSLPAASVVTRPPVLHVPRWCSVSDELCLSIYTWNGGGYGFNGSYALTRQYQSQYAPENLIALPDGFEPDTEQCGCCGKWTPHRKVGAVWCPRCRAFVCYGNTSLSGYFVCRASCGFEGQCTAQRHPEMGFVMGRKV